ncbi:hypothetical protein KCU61_g7994, partial [Aureobasidium melanogenum]
MANNSSSAAGTHAPSNIPGLSEEIRSLRRPLNTDAYYSCSRQEWDNLCRQTLVLASKTKATTVLMKKSRAGKIHETADGEAALRRCSACTKGNNGNGYDCYLSYNSTTKTCAHCAFSNKSKCDAQRAPTGANNPIVPPPVAPHLTLRLPALPPPAVTNPAFVAAKAPHPVPLATPVQPFVSGPAGVAVQVPIEPYFSQAPGEWAGEDIDDMVDMGLAHASYVVRRDQENERQ